MSGATSPLPVYTFRAPRKATILPSFRANSNHGQHRSGWAKERSNNKSASYDGRQFWFGKPWINKWNEVGTWKRNDLFQLVSCSRWETITWHRFSSILGWYLKLVSRLRTAGGQCGAHTLDVHESVHRDSIMKSNQQGATILLLLLLLRLLLLLLLPIGLRPF